MFFVLSKSGSIVSRGIRWFTRGEFSHASFLFERTSIVRDAIDAFCHTYPEQAGPYVPELFSKEPLIIEAVWPRVRAVRFSQAFTDPASYRVFCVGTSVEQDVKLIAWCLQQLGKPYDLVGDIHFFTRQGYAVQPEHKWFCSEMLFEGLERIAILLFLLTEGWEVWPDLCKRSPIVRPSCWQPLKPITT